MGCDRGTLIELMSDSVNTVRFLGILDAAELVEIHWYRY